MDQEVDPMASLQEDKKVERLNLLINMSALINSTLDIQEIIKYAIEGSTRLLDAEAGSLLFLEEEAGELFFAEAVGEKSKKVRGIKLRTGQGVAGWVAEKGKPLIVQDASSDPRFFDGVDKISGFVTRNIVCVPVRTKDKILGSIEVVNKHSGSFDLDDVLILTALANQVGVAIENARLYEESIADDLTGLYQRKFFELRFEEELKRSKRYKHPLNLVMIDIDYFKRVNDEHGHLIGDAVLREVALVLKESTRLEDIVARYGGEEFAIVMPHTPVEDMRKTSEKLRAEIEEMEVSGVRITISVGIGHFDGKDMDFNGRDLIKRADEALYLAKKRGRNRVEMIV
jgi:diguanylate cyclase (GGDEF)-like protein